MLFALMHALGWMHVPGHSVEQTTPLSQRSPGSPSVYSVEASAHMARLSGLDGRRAAATCRLTLTSRRSSLRPSGGAERAAWSSGCSQKARQMQGGGARRARARRARASRTRRATPLGRGNTPLPTMRPSGRWSSMPLREERQRCSVGRTRGLPAGRHRVSENDEVGRDTVHPPPSSLP